MTAWWRENRPAARVRVDDALEAAVTAMAEHPGLGPTYSRDPRYRIWRLRGTPHVLFYRVDEAVGTIWIVVAWSALRGSGPELP
ncbi:MAG: type II toxin-antitoxin system RelE/ParE family toxin [Anaeromyxobacteraceae bacterium]|nr:type II toxin-antitoxin system RelE/ParE family toxin [Anaeromyxobacteraceae bacterium]